MIIDALHFIFIGGWKIVLGAYLAFLVSANNPRVAVYIKEKSKRIWSWERRL